jgi:hypothetical protein
VISGILNIFATSLELVGVLLLANHYLKIRIRKIPAMLLSALIGGRMSRAAANLARLADDDPIVSLRGLAFIASGFLVQLISNFIQIYFTATAS